MKDVKLSKITVSHLVVNNIVYIHIGVNLKKLQPTALLVCKELQIGRNALTACHGHLPARHECYFLQGSVKTLFRWGGKGLHHVSTNIIGKIRTKLYKNRSRFVKDMTKHLGVFFGSQFQPMFICKTRMLSFTR